MIDHISIGVSDFGQSLTFYDNVLSELGFKRCMDIEFDGIQAAGYGLDSDIEPSFWIGRKHDVMAAITPSVGFHIAFQATTRDAVDAFYTAAMAAGATDNGKPGLRPQYHANYYAAFVLDPDGYNVEAVCHQPL
ncbi:VOC family protein [Planktothrix sp. FACHB-1355]|uniref:VOC family protein n=1 Tax=Aerosakkonema funiforme FACHB-1375 TaxID=2949571 RepID=A0A926VEM3_9CYAN|nr:MULTISPECIES: VOC family protein [Oscillatoriales]MBD2182455.1 VOC family protein [Aerosakkonema funiforme FACHB-1375]MBD3562728.1 VOC family protein [Planktothrix sp. FACHB-1355]